MYFVGASTNLTIGWVEGVLQRGCLASIFPAVRSVMYGVWSTYGLLSGHVLHTEDGVHIGTDCCQVKVRSMKYRYIQTEVPISHHITL